MYLRTYLCFLTFILLSFVFPVVIFIEKTTVLSNTNVAITYLIILYCSFKLAYLSFKNEQRILELTFWLFTYIWMGLVPFTHLLTGTYSWDASFYPQDLFFQSLGIIILGFISYDLGIFFANKKNKKAKDSEYTLSGNSKSISKQWMNICILISFVLSFIITELLGGFGQLFLSRNDLSALYGDSFTKTNGLILSNLQKVPIFVCLVFVIYLNKLKSKNKKMVLKKKYLFLVSILLLANIIINNPISNPRYWFGSIIITVIMIMFKWGKRSFSNWVIGLSLILLVIFPYADLFRGSTNFSLDVKPLSYQLTEKGDFDAFQQLMNTVNYVHAIGPLWGKQFLGAILFWIPRSIWINKPVGTGQLVAEFSGYRYTNLSCPLWAESYINFGYFGVILIFFMWGYFTSIMQNKYIEENIGDNISLSRIIIPFISGYQIFLLRGDLLNGVAYLSCFILFSYLLLKLNPRKVYRLEWR